MAHGSVCFVSTQTAESDRLVALGFLGQLTENYDGALSGVTDNVMKILKGLK